SLLDASGYIDAVERTVTEKAASGGTVSLLSAGDLIMRPGSTVDVSGGGYRYGAGSPQSTLLRGADDKVYDISTAPPDLTYTALLDQWVVVHPRWGPQATEVFVNPLGVRRREDPYVDGKPGGALTLSAVNGMILDGMLLGGVTVGPNQFGQAPLGATLTIGGA